MTIRDENRDELLALVQAAAGAIPVAGPLIANLVPLVPLVVRLMQDQDRSTVRRPGSEKKARVLGSVKAVAFALGADGDRIARQADEILEGRIRQRRVASALRKWLGAAVDLDRDDDQWIQVPGATLDRRDVDMALSLLEEWQG